MFVVEQRFVDQRDREVRLLMTADLSGYDPGPAAVDRGQYDARSGACLESRSVVASRRYLRNRYLAAKHLDGARLGGLNLQRTEFRDTTLRGAILRCADLEGASLLHADLTDADLSGAWLQGADLRDANLGGAALPLRSDAWAKVKVNAGTCWPEGFPRRLDSLRLHVRPKDGAPLSAGHVCGGRQLVSAEGRPIESLGEVPRASGEVAPSSAAPVRLSPATVEAIGDEVGRAVKAALATGSGTAVTPSPTASTVPPAPPVGTPAATPTPIAP